MASDQDTYEMDPVKFGQTIRKARLAMALEVSEAARAAQMSAAQWHKLEAGTGGVPRVSTQRKMREAVGLEDPGPRVQPGASDREVLNQVVRNLGDLAREIRELRKVVEGLAGQGHPVATAARNAAARRARS